MHQTGDASSEIDLWLTPERIACSDFMAMVFQSVHAGTWSVAEAQEISLSALEGFANGSCYFLASAVAEARGGVIVGFWRRRGDERLVHAALVNGSDGYACDILGRRPLSILRSEMEQAVGDVRITVLPPLGDEMQAEEKEVLLRIAAGLPWMGIRGPEHDHVGWADLVHGYVTARSADLGPAR